ncbi:hypothetical protein [Pseudomonas phage D6]|nr:hypothetical protein [Pseudomonas phage D6]
MFKGMMWALTFLMGGVLWVWLSSSVALLAGNGKIDRQLYKWFTCTVAVLFLLYLSAPVIYTIAGVE